MMPLQAHEIGGGRVCRRFVMRGQDVPGGTVLTAAEIAAIPAANLRSLIENRFLFVWPRAAVTGGASERFVVSRGAGKYDVVAGQRLNRAPLSHDDARALANGEAGNA